MKILLVDDHALMRDLLANELLKESEVREVFQAGSAKKVLDLLPDINPDMLIADISMPGMDGITLVQKLRADGFDKPVLILSMHKDAHLAKRALAAGATGMAAKQDSLDSLVFAVKQTMLGERYLSPALLEDQLISADTSTPAGLSPREQQVLVLIASGKSTKVISDGLGLSPRTVDAHRRNIIAKTGARNAADMTRLAVELGLIASTKNFDGQ